MLVAVGEEACRPFKGLAADGQPDVRRLLHVAHPLTIYVCSSEIDLVAIQHEPNRDIEGLPRFATVMRQGQGLSSRYRLQSRQCIRIHGCLVEVTVITVET